MFILGNKKSYIYDLTLVIDIDDLNLSAIRWQLRANFTEQFEKWFMTTPLILMQ